METTHQPQLHKRCPEPGCVAARFWSKVRRGDPDECWPWTGPANHKAGYGDFCVPGRGNIRAHVFAAELGTGRPRPAGQDTRHSCDNPPCCNPAHLSYGSRLRNVRDAVQRNRVAHGERSGHAKLTEADVVAIRERCAAGEMLLTIAADYRVSASAIAAITDGRYWRRSPGPVRPVSRQMGRPTRLTEADARVIRERYAAGEKGVTLAAEYGASSAQISHVVNGQVWVNAGGPITGRGRRGPRHNGKSRP